MRELGRTVLSHDLQLLAQHAAAGVDLFGAQNQRIFTVFSLIAMVPDSEFRNPIFTEPSEVSTQEVAGKYLPFDYTGGCNTTSHAAASIAGPWATSR